MLYKGLNFMSLLLIISNINSLSLFLLSIFRPLTTGLRRAGPLRTRTTRSTSASERCRTRPDWSWPTTRPRTWPASRRCSAGSGSTSSCRRRPSPRWTRRGTSRSGRSWTRRNGRSGTSIARRQVRVFPDAFQPLNCPLCISCMT